MQRLLSSLLSVAVLNGEFAIDPTKFSESMGLGELSDSPMKLAANGAVPVLWVLIDAPTGPISVRIDLSNRAVEIESTDKAHTLESEISEIRGLTLDGEELADLV